MCAATSTSFKTVTRDIVTKYLEEEKERKPASFKAVTGDIVTKYLEEEEKKRRRLACKKRNGRKTEKLSSDREKELLLEIASLTDSLQTARKTVKHRENRKRELENERKMQMKAEKERAWEELKEIERIFLERQRKRNMEFVEREQEWKKVRETMKMLEREHHRKQKLMDKKMRKMEKQIENLKKTEEKEKGPEKEEKSFRKTVSGWMERLFITFRSLKQRERAPTTDDSTEVEPSSTAPAI